MTEESKSKKKGVYIEAAAPLTKEGIISVCKEESSLSDKIRTDGSYQDVYVKEAVKKLKEEILKLVPEEATSTVQHTINKIFGAKLT